VNSGDFSDIAFTLDGRIVAVTDISGDAAYL
jgi:hypothetical protein